MEFKGKHIISINDLTKQEILHILSIASEFDALQQSFLLRGKILATLFFEPSTRTRLSFETAMHRLGGSVIGFGSAAITSVQKGETLADTISMIHGYADAIVIRHHIEGAARLASQISKVPVINAGDGANQHPTQTLVDLYTIRKAQNTIDGLSIAMVGDLKYGRTVHSLAVALAHFKVKLYFVAPEELKMPVKVTEHLKKNNIDYFESAQIEDVLDKVDILYMTRIQKERFPDLKEYEKIKNVYILNASMLKKEIVKDNLKILHPLPRINEITQEVDATKYAYYFQQAHNGIPVRKALLALVMGAV